ncbi:acetyl-CoA carboxylase biotin carboxyl carrier protein [Tropicimonas sp. IMCC34043]|uniref:acetyl-CoA carboxylase biotin carboxyl carrier protein n=1 Tax=Tropicimonas sp. IMCC34043 TaxID=2248760 RepID=UPI000E2736E9|nr:acetyl-CoA carboxylase biotin carboxyl carrier protein [Tropicimonas sp. IMCC34043]
MTNKSQDADVAFIEALAALLRANDLTELEVKREYGDNDNLTVKVSRQFPVPQYFAAAPAAPAAPQMMAAPSGAPAPAPVAAPALEVEDPAQLPGAVTSPMVGTVYLSPEPGTPVFVAIGDLVEEGQTLLIIEAMKTMNQIPAPRAGMVKRILIENGAPVEFGAPLMIIE